MKCLNDGVEFEPKRATAKFCSPKCRLQYARKNNIDENTGEVLSASAELTDESIKENLARVPKDPNPFAASNKDPNYDAEGALKAFQKMGLTQVEWITTGITDFDELTKIPRGRITQIQGPYAVGKTTLCLNMIRGMKKQKVLYIDSEAALNPQLLKDLEISPTNFELYNESAFIEDIYEVVLKASKSGKYDLIILDSLAGCTFRTEEAGDSTASNIGQKAKIVNKMMRIVPMQCKNSDTALVIINQEREFIGGYVPTKYTPGGMGPVYAASLIVALKTIKSWRFPKDPKNNLYLGHEVEATIIKSKVNQPWRVKKFKLYYPEPVEQPPEVVPAF